MGTREWLYRQMNSLVSLEIMIAVEALRTLITLERTIWGWRGKTVGWRVASIEVLGICHMTAVESRQKSRLHTPHHSHRTIRAVDVGHHGSVHRRKGVRRPGLAGRISEVRLACRTLGGHPSRVVHSKSSAPQGRSRVYGRKSSLVRAQMRWGAI